MDPIFTGIFIVVGGIAAVVGGYVAVDKWQEYKVKQIVAVKKLEDRASDEERLKEMITEIVTAAFTGRAEADHLLRNDLLRHIKDSHREALDEHAKDERLYIDGLRDKIAEYHATSLQAIQDAKRVALHVSMEYQTIQRRLNEMEETLENIKRDLRELENHSHGGST